MGIESTHDNHLVLKNRQLRSLAMIIIAYLKQESKFVDKEDFFTRIMVSFLGRNILIIIKQDY